ncbi:hypothetical protein SAMN05421866_1199 [Chryseobacterium oranimense]|uniref:MORN repeat variant n=1 Tax=Chryseobacterium oranimense TaxID=421058 RepID=A0A1M5LUA2_9FLAO|nr:hypothetical protein [Chryseobacterium oranimense]SHG67973.1 hypothetical protein SAMN05421866_1199 [Chryseobacterium oranimense]
MNFEIKYGKGLLSINYEPRYYSESLTIGKSPVLFLWDDCDDPGDENLVLLPVDEESKYLINNTLQNIDLDVDYTDRIEDLFDVLKPLLRLLKNGKYHLSFSEHRLHKSFGPIAAFAEERLNREEVEKEIEKYNGKLYQNNIYDYTYRGQYDSTYRFNEYELPFVAWKSRQETNINLIQHYESLISSGARPFAIIFTSEFLEDNYLHEYILDGHHKLCAYKNLGIDPPCAVIKFIAEEKGQLGLDLERISELIFPWQFNHFYNNWDGKEEYFKNNPHSMLKKHIKNGWITFLYPDGRKRGEGFYINDIPDGDFKYWYENGKISNVKSFSFGKPVRKSVYYHDDVAVDAENYGNKGYEFIYKDGDLRITKNWNREGKIESIAVHEPKSIKQTPLTEQVVWEYSSESYKNILKQRKEDEIKKKLEKEERDLQLAKIRKQEKIYEWLKILLVMVIIVVIVIYFYKT